MTTNFTKHLIAMFLVSFAGAAMAQQDAEPPVAVKTEGLPLHVAAKVKEKAAEGVTSLRRYVTSTRMVNGLDIRSIVREEASPTMALNAKAEQPVQVAAKDQRR